MCASYDSLVAQGTTLEVPDSLPDLFEEQCDRCVARAQFRVQLNAGDLYLCSHHHRVHAAALALAVKVPRSL